MSGSGLLTRRIHLDTDIAGDPDDVCALALLLSLPNVELTGVTTVIEQDGRRAGYAYEIARLAGKSEIPIAAGAIDRIDGLAVRAGIPDGPDFWPTAVEPRPGTVDDALALIDNSIEQGATVVGIGPYTNLALYEQLYPGKLAKSALVIMGGLVGPMGDGLPPWSPKDDWNMLVDPEASRIVVERCNPLIVPMNVTAQVHLRARDLPRLRKSGPLGELMASQAEANDRLYNNRKLGKAYALLPDDLLNFHHDPLAAAVALDWNGVTVETINLRFETDQNSVTGDLDAAGLRVVTKVDSERFNRFWLDAVCRKERRK